jgi:hypothetical protein
VGAHCSCQGVVRHGIPSHCIAYARSGGCPAIVRRHLECDGRDLWVLPFAVQVFRTEKYSARPAFGLALGFARCADRARFWQAEASNLTGQLMCAVAALSVTASRFPTSSAS